MGSSKKIISATIWTTILNVVNAAYGFVSVPILINYFGKAEYGLIGLAVSVNVYLQFMDMGFTNTNIRFFSSWLARNEKSKLVKAFQTSLSFYGIIGLLNSLAMLLVAYYSASWFNVTPEQDVVLKHLFYILALTSFISWFSSCYDQLIKSTENVAWVQKRTLFTKVLMIIVLFLTVIMELSIENYYILTCAATLSIVPLSYKKIRKNLPFIKFLPRWNNDIFKEMLPYSLNIFSFGLFQFAFLQLRPVLLGIRSTLESVTDYQVLYGITSIVQLMGGAFVNILLPSTSKIVAQHDKDAYYRVAYDGTKYISILKCFCCFGLMAVGQELVLLYVGESYLYLIPWLYIWLVCMLGSHNQAISSLIFAGADVRALSYSSAIAATVGLISSWITIPYFQVGGVVIGFICYATVQQIFFYFYYWPQKMKINSVRVFTKSFFPFVVVGAIAFLLTRLIPIAVSPWIAVFLRGFVFSLIFLITVFLMLNDADKKFLLKNIKK